MRTARYTPAEAAATVDRILTAILAPDVPLTPGTTITTDLRADSLDMVEIAMDLEIAFGIEVSDRSLEGARTVADLHALPCALLREQDRITEEAA